MWTCHISTKSFECYILVWNKGDFLYLQLDHPAIENIFVSGGCAVCVQHVAGVSHPVLQLLQSLGEKLVLRDNSVNP